MDIDQVLDCHPFTLPPFPHQREALRRSCMKWFFAYFMDQGTGKTKVVIDNCAILFMRKVIDALLIVAPNDVHAQWVDEQIPLHMPRQIQLRTAIWRASSKRSQRECAELITRPLPGRLSVLSMNHDAFATAKGRAMALKFLRKYKVFLALDESDLCIKTPKALRTRCLVNTVSPLCKVRRIMTGTPAANPFELYSQFKFLDERIIGFDSLLTFKHRYALWTKEFAQFKNKHTGQMQLREYEQLQEYQNLDELYSRIDPYVFRIRKEDCLGLPPKLYATRQTHLSKAQRDIYNEIRENGLVMIARREVTEGRVSPPLVVERIDELTEDELLIRMQEAGERTTAALKITLVLRLQQIIGGFLTDDNRTVRAIDGNRPCPRMEQTMALIRGALRGSAKVIVWAIFKAELKLLQALCDIEWRDEGIKAVSIHGDVKGKAREQALSDFKDVKSNRRILIAHPRSVGTGFNFTVAQTAIYYSCGASSRDRIQSEDRIHRIGQKGTVSIYDVTCPEVPIDERLRTLRQTKQDFNTAVMSWTAKQMEVMV